MSNFNWPINPTTVNSGPIQFILDGANTTVEEDSGTPANSTPLPVKVIDPSGVPIDFATAANQTTQIGLETDIETNTAATVSELTTLNTVDFATEAKQDDQITEAVAGNVLLTDIETNTSSIDSKLPLTLGQKAMSASLAVAIASDQSSIPVTGPLTDVQLRASPVPVSLASAPLPTGAATEAKQDAQIVLETALNGLVATAANQAAEAILIGAVNETAPATDTASSGLNGRLQRIAQRITSLITLFPTSLGQKTSADSLAVVPASDYIPPGSAVPTAVTVKSAWITAGLTAIRLTTDAAAPSATRRKLNFMPDPGSSANFFVGPSGVTITSGLQIFPGQNIDWVNDPNDYYIISSSATQSVYVLECE